MTDDGLPGLYLIIIIVLIMIFNALVVASKRALDYIDRNIIKEALEDNPDNKKLQAVAAFLAKPSMYHYANHAASFISIVICFFLFNVLMFLIDASNNSSDGFGFYKDAFGIFMLLLCNIGFYIIYTALSDILPKKLAAQSSERYGVGLVGFQKFIYYITFPLVWICRGIANALLRIFGKQTDVDDSYFSEDKVMSMLDRGQETGEIKEEGRKMIDSIFEFDDLLAYEIMTPRTDVFAIDINDEPSEYIDELMGLKYTRIPVYEDDSDNIIGVLNIKDYLIQAREQGFDNVDIRAILRTPYLVPETKNIDSLFFELQKTKQQIAILIDEYGGFCGIVTMEDIIEEVMGDIDDEYDEEEHELTKIGKDLYVIEGSMYLDDINEELGTNLESEDSETIGGYIIDMFGEIPDEDDIGREIFAGNIVFTIQSVRDKRIEKVVMKINQEEQAV